MASKWSVSTKRNKPAVKNKSRPPARINGARGRLRAFSCLFLNAWGFESPYGVKWAMRISQTAVFGASDPYFRKSNFSVPNPPVFSSECKNTALSCGVFGVASFINTFWSLWPDSNRRPAHYECAALPTEPHKQLFAAGTSLFSFTVFSVYHAFESSSIFF